MIRQRAFLVGFVLLLLACVLPVMAVPASKTAQAAQTEVIIFSKNTTVADEAAIALLQKRIEAHNKANGKSTQQRGLLDIATSIFMAWKNFHGGCQYGNNCGGGCSTAVGGWGSGLFLQSILNKRVTDDLDEACYNHDVCLFNKRNNPSSWTCTSKFGAPCDVGCDYDLYNKARSIWDSCPW